MVKTEGPTSIFKGLSVRRLSRISDVFRTDYTDRVGLNVQRDVIASLIISSGHGQGMLTASPQFRITNGMLRYLQDNDTQSLSEDKYR